MTYAIVRTGGKQYRVEPGQRLLVERLPAEVGATVSLEPLLFRSEEVAIDRDSLARVQVSAKVLAHERGPKLRVFKFKPKRGYKRRTGHRQELTRIEVAEIKSGAARSRAAKESSAEGPANAAATDKPAAEGKTAAARKPAARKPSGAQKPSDAETPSDAEKPSRAGKPRSRSTKSKEAEDGS